MLILKQRYERELEIAGCWFSTFGVKGFFTPPPTGIVLEKMNIEIIIYNSSKTTVMMSQQK